jgi:glycosyltransferase involved in cell wall biosynthesis
VYNHADKVTDVVQKALTLGIPTFVVDDGSTDDTTERLKGISGATLLHHKHNRGKGAALMTGFAAAAEVADWALTMDADGQHNPLEAHELLKILPRDRRVIVVGVRRGMEGVHTPWTSRFGRGFSNFWVRASGGPKLSDTQSGFRVYPLPEVLQLRPRAKRFQFEVEVLVLAHWHRLPVIEAPVTVVYTAERISHFRPFVDFWRNSFTFIRLMTLRFLIPRALRARRIDVNRAS